MIHLTCTPEEFAPPEYSSVRWLERDADYELACGLWATRQQELTYPTWVEAHSLRYTYAGIIEEGKLISCGAVWSYSEQAWEVAAVVTRDGYRRWGYTKQVVAFVTAYILEQGRPPTCTTKRWSMKDEQVLVWRTLLPVPKLPQQVLNRVKPGVEAVDNAGSRFAGRVLFESLTIQLFPTKSNTK